MRTRIDVDAFPIAPPSGGGLVEAAVPSDLVAAAILYDSGLFMEDGAVIDRLAAGIARHRNFHIKMPPSDHPGEQFERGRCLGVGRRQRQGRQVFPDPFAKVFARLDGLDLGRLQRATDDQAHVAAIAHQTLDAARRQRERAGVEIPGQAIIALGVFKRGDIEEPDEIAVLGRVFPLP